MKLNRRTMLRGAGVAMALPWLDGLARGADREGQDSEPPRRMVAICNSLSLHAPFFTPEGEGEGWKASRYLRELEPLRDQMTVLSGISHPGVDGGHIAEKSFLTGAPHPSGGSFRNTISLDQLAAETIGRRTRFPSIVMSAQPNSSLSWTRAGVPIPGERSPGRLFAKLFLDDPKEDAARRVVEMRQGRSIMDAVRDQASSLSRRLGPADRRKLDEYLTSVRGVERQLANRQSWADTPKPRVTSRPPKNAYAQADVIGQNRAMFDLARLAVQTDSTRAVTILTQGLFVVPPIAGVEDGYHTVSHHGQNPGKLEQLALIELEQMRALRDFAQGLADVEEGGGSLLDRTIVFYGSNMGNASSHDNRNLPGLVLGGGFRHGRHLAFDRDDNRPLCDLYVSMLQRLGVETDRFGSSRGTLTGLELA